MSEREALDIYFTWAAEAGADKEREYAAPDKAAIADEVREMIVAPSLAAAAKVIEWWGEDPSGMWTSLKVARWIRKEVGRRA